MKCPVCNFELKPIKTLITFSNSGKEYNHNRYHCDKDDVWVIVEIPKKISKKV